MLHFFTVQKFKRSDIGSGPTFTKSRDATMMWPFSDHSNSKFLHQQLRRTRCCNTTQEDYSTTPHNSRDDSIATTGQSCSICPTSPYCRPFSGFVMVVLQSIKVSVYVNEAANGKRILRLTESYISLAVMITKKKPLLTMLVRCGN